MTHAHTPESATQERKQAAQRSTWVSVAVNVVLVALQMVVGLVSHSAALVADAVHSLSDIVADGVVLFANRHSHKAADDDHPYGHYRFENAASFVLGVILLLVGVSMIWSAANKLQTPSAGTNSLTLIALGVAIFTLIAKEGLFRYLLSVANRVRSSMLMANAYHARSDAASSLVVALGIGGSLMGYPFLDKIAAAIVGFMIAKMGWEFAWTALSDLMDRALDDETVQAISQTLALTPGVLSLHAIRTRKMGDLAVIDAHLTVAPTISVSEGHYIADLARQRVFNEHTVLDVLIHIDPEDDSITPHKHLQLPSRGEFLAMLQRELPENFNLSHYRIGLHYLGGTLAVEVHPLQAQADPAQAPLREAIHRLNQNTPYAIKSYL